MIEVLTAVALIGVLIALLVTAIQSMRPKAAATKCLSNLRQIGAASALWSNDNDGKTVYSWYGSPPNTPWFMMLAPYLGGLDNNKVWVCSAQPHSGQYGAWPNGDLGFGGSVDYAQNLINDTFGLDGAMPRASSLNSAVPASRIVYLIEGRNVFYDQASWDAWVAPFLAHHKGHSNLLFLDYHAEPIKDVTYEKVEAATLK